MKKFLAVLAIAGTLVACNNTGDDTTTTDSTTTVTTDSMTVAPGVTDTMNMVTTDSTITTVDSTK